MSRGAELLPVDPIDWSYGPNVRSTPEKTAMIHLAAIALSLPLAAAPSEPRGRYVEARTAAVFAGACHYGGQATTQGRGALLAWHFEGGSHQGVDLSGVDLAVVLSAQTNLADAGVKRHSWIYVSDASSPKVRDAAVDWLRTREPALLGTVERVSAVPLSLSIGAERYALRSEAGFALKGALLPDRACCSMPFNVWYRPFVALVGALVGHNDEFRVEDRAVGDRWSRPDENAAFTGRFGS
jgi:hypothetical protein